MKTQASLTPVTGPALLAALLTALLTGRASPAQCVLVADLTPGTANNGNLGGLVAGFGHELYFYAHTAATGGELWKWNAAQGAVMVSDLVPGQGGSSPAEITPCCTAAGPRVFFQAFRTGQGRELYASDGTAAGTSLVLEIRPGSASSLPIDFCAFRGQVLFNARDSTFGEELWRSDGTAAGTQRVLDLWPGTGNGRPQELFAFDDRLLFSAADPTHGRELWITDGTAAGTQLLLDIWPGSFDSTPRHLTRAGDYVYFSACDPSGAEVWRTDGTQAGTTRIGDLFPASSGGPVDLCACGDLLFFHEWTSGGAGPVFASDGTAAGTVNLGVTGKNLACSGNRVFFAGSVAGTGLEPFTSDGTIAGTHMIADLQPGPLSSRPEKFIACGAGACFVADTTVGGELWFSDGTQAGTTLLCALDPGGNSHPDLLTMCRGRLFLHAYDPAFGRELFAIPTPGAATAHLGSGSGPDFPTLATVNGAVPVLGTSLDLRGTGPSGHAGVLLGAVTALPAPVPAVPALVDGGCDWVGLQAGAATTLATTFTTSLTWTLNVPNGPAFEGLPVNFQIAWWDFAAVPILQVSNGLQLVVGSAAPH